MDQLIALVQEKIPGFGRRVMTFEDFLGACAAEKIVVELKPHELDEQLIRKPAAKIVLNAGLSEKYRTFAGFHALAHWIGHPARSEFYLGSPGWLGSIELEASAIGYLALAPHPKGSPWPRLVKAQASQLEMQFWIEYPSKEPGEELRWRRRKTTLIRAGQGELPFGQGQLL